MHTLVNFYTEYFWYLLMKFVTWTGKFIKNTLIYIVWIVSRNIITRYEVPHTKHMEVRNGED